MLVLKRKENESIIIADSIEIMITSVGRKEVKVGIKAPRHVPIYRKELRPFLSGNIKDKMTFRDCRSNLILV